MRSQTQTLTAAGAGAWIPVDPHRCPFSIGFGVKLEGGSSLTYTVQHTFDDPFDAEAVAAGLEAFDHPDVAGETANADGHYAHPVRAIRLNIDAYTDGSATLTLIQAG